MGGRGNAQRRLESLGTRCAEQFAYPPLRLVEQTPAAHARRGTCNRCDSDSRRGHRWPADKDTHAQVGRHDRQEISGACGAKEALANSSASTRFALGATRSSSLEEGMAWGPVHHLRPLPSSNNRAQCSSAHDRPHHLALPRPREIGRGRHGRGLQGRGHEAPARRRTEVHLRDAVGRSLRGRAVSARGAGRLRHQSSAHLRRLRRRRAGRTALHRDGVHGGDAAQSAPRRRTPATGTGARPWQRDRRCTRGGAHQRDSSPRHQARQHLRDRGRPCQAARLRGRQGAVGSGTLRATDRGAIELPGRGAWHARIHVA